MLYLIYEHYVSLFPFLNIFSYITVRAMGAALTALLIAILSGGYIIETLKKLAFGQTAKGFEPEAHNAKKNTPIMGGLIFIIPTVIATIIWGNPYNDYTYILLFALLGFGAIGFIDDYKKTVLKNPLGISSKQKSVMQLIASLIIIAFYYYAYDPTQHDITTLHIPMLKGVVIDLSYFFIAFALVVLIGTSNAVNLTDGLDGLAIMPSILAFMVLGVFAYLEGSTAFAAYLYLPQILGGAEITIFLAALVGASLGFLWFNCSPAEVFMGDVGSIALGGVIGTTALILKQEILLVLLCGVFVIETLSVIMQVSYFKATKGKRIFLMAPLHHHYELKGLKEQKIVIRFWIVSVILAILSLATIKLR